MNHILPFCVNFEFMVFSLSDSLYSIAIFFFICFLLYSDKAANNECVPRDLCDCLSHTICFCAYLVFFDCCVGF